MRAIALASTMLLALGTAAAQAADQVKLGLMTPLSGPISPAGTETKRGVDLALEETRQQVGRPAGQVHGGRRQDNPAEAVQGASKLIDDAKVDFVTGFSGSNTMIRSGRPSATPASHCRRTRGPLQFAGKDCVQRLCPFVLERRFAAAIGKYMSEKGIKECVFSSARTNQAGYEHVGAA